jgi:hypothetical protein
LREWLAREPDNPLDTWLDGIFDASGVEDLLGEESERH